MLSLTGCAKEKDYLDVFREQRSAWRDLTEVLATVRDEKSMADAKGTLEDRLEKYEKIAAKARALPKPSAQILMKLEQDRASMQRAAENLQDEVRRVRALPGGPAFLKKFESQSPGLLSAEQP